MSCRVYRRVRGADLVCAVGAVQLNWTEKLKEWRGRERESMRAGDAGGEGESERERGGEMRREMPRGSVRRWERERGWEREMQ